MEQILNRKDFTNWLVDSDIPYDAEAEQIQFSEMSPSETLEVLVTANDANVDIVSDSLTAHYASPNTSVTDKDSFENTYVDSIRLAAQLEAESDEDSRSYENHDDLVRMKDIRKMSVNKVVEICKTVHSVDSLHFGGYDVTRGSGSWNIVSTQ